MKTTYNLKEGTKKDHDFSKLTGLLALFVVASICFSSYTVFFGVDSLKIKALLAPQVLWAALELVKRFTR